jgi:hypothetical protein
MDHQEIIDLLAIIDQQVSSSILGGREEDYEELENQGWVKINRDSSQWSASLTPEGRAYLENDT